jgi:hypothetical protein
VSIASVSVFIWEARSLRRMAMCLAKPIAHPMREMRRISILEMYLYMRGGGR